MVNKLDALLSVHEQALALRLKRQELIASNIANADTPHYKARDLDFAQALARATGQTAEMIRTSARHLTASSGADGTPKVLYRVPLQPSLDGNTVEMDVERAHFADNAVRAEASIRFISSKIKAMLAVITG
ncbi:flagellar basal body rod protein FlgB [Pelomicrobium methylotrophicum]|uniref:Flagellar basal body rod protein FlgB n=1 Tax=Pelomicrobium methylotrophicum TaxID=2602750 RepID=A0A5C7EHT9_9PROT|nr:flagellar basal body rod protein FlgB [Pelomicrobium methylotrophicum]TXF11826.1 flagellar basal body rod protein FlgB [Pelomicrobium methylotrophicum]